MTFTFWVNFKRSILKYLALTPKFTKNTHRKNQSIFLKEVQTVFDYYFVYSENKASIMLRSALFPICLWALLIWSNVKNSSLGFLSNRKHLEKKRNNYKERLLLNRIEAVPGLTTSLNVCWADERTRMELIACSKPFAWATPNDSKILNKYWFRFNGLHTTFFTFQHLLNIRTTFVKPFNGYWNVETGSTS